MLFGYKILVYCTSQIHRSSFQAFVSSLNDELIKNNWRLLVFCSESDFAVTNTNSRGNLNIFELINYDITDAIVFSDERLKVPELRDKVLTIAKEKNIPFFLMDGYENDTYNIRFDQGHSFKKIVKHIVEQHEITSLHFLAGTKDSSQSLLRLNAFKEVLKDNNIPFDESMVSYGDFWDGPAMVAVQKLVDENRVPRAIICANDTMAIASVTVLEKNGYKCPRDVIVTGFDGIDAVLYSNPKITSVLCNFHILAIETAHFIFDVIANHTPPSTRLVDGSIMISESCGCNSIAPSNSLEYINNLTNAYASYRYENIALSNLSSLIITSKNLTELIKNLNNGLLYNCMCLVKAECIDENIDPNISHTSTTYGESVFVLHDSDSNEENPNHFIKTTELIPRMKDTLDIEKKPLIFAPINNINQPLGYMMFSFYDYSQQNFVKVNQITTWLGNAISSYRNTKYQQQLQKKLEDMYRHDSLTGLFNRNGFMRIYQEVISDSNVKTITLAVCDLDNLKKINDNYSHNEGDNAIRVIANALSQTGETGAFCRYGGDEIIGLYSHAVNIDNIQKNLQKYIDDYNSSSGKPYTVSTSIGIYTSEKASFEEMFAKADELMYKQKITKKNRRK